MFIVLLKLLGYAVGSVVMYWGLLLLLLAPWVVILLLVALLNAVWNRITGKTDEWKWLLRGTEFMGQVVQQMKVEWVGWIAGLLIQIWYAGYAAHLVHTSALDRVTIDAIALRGMGCLGIIATATIAYGLYRLMLDLRPSKWLCILVGGIAMAAYFVFLQNPPIAEGLNQGWQKIFAALLYVIL